MAELLLSRLQREPQHGYKLHRWLRAIGVVMGDPGVVYHELHALEQAPLVRSGWDMSAPGPARRVYTLTALGEERENSMGSTRT